MPEIEPEHADERFGGEAGSRVCLVCVVVAVERTQCINTMAN